MNIVNKIIEEFSLPETQAIYRDKAKEGLWGSEKTLIQKFFKQGARVLDLGCGTGRVSIPLKRLGYIVVGIDIVPAMIESAVSIACSENVEIDYQVGDARSLPFESNSFEGVIFSNNGWTQIPGKKERVEALTDICRVVKTDCYVIFVVNIRKFWKFPFFWSRQWLKVNVLKKLGFFVRENEYGDTFFTRTRNHSSYQFIHIPSHRDVLKIVQESGLSLVYEETASGITDAEQVKFPPVFFVCRK